MAADVEEHADRVVGVGHELVVGEPGDLVAVALGEMISGLVALEVGLTGVPQTAVGLDDATPVGDELVDIAAARRATTAAAPGTRAAADEGRPAPPSAPVRARWPAASCPTDSSSSTARTVTSPRGCSGSSRSASSRSASIEVTRLTTRSCTRSRTPSRPSSTARSSTMRSIRVVRIPCTTIGSTSCRRCTRATELRLDDPGSTVRSMRPGRNPGTWWSTPDDRCDSTDPDRLSSAALAWRNHVNGCVASA